MRVLQADRPTGRDLSELLWLPEGRIICPKEMQTSGRRAHGASITSTNGVGFNGTCVGMRRPTTTCCLSPSIEFTSVARSIFVTEPRQQGRIGPDQMSSLVFSLTG